ncbi:MAG: adenylate/guanylate cyclase domain-containing protein [Spirochaetes bacterium]|jgi:adenylate cyclase|nr:adenylate/guanylate cyclase domain-containing protein [Spirochaetota bacterium]
MFTQKIKSVVEFWKENIFSPDAADILKMEEYNGAVMANRFRYIFLAIAAVPIFINANVSIMGGNIAGVFVNSVAFLVYLLFTLGHTFILARRWDRLNRVFGYMVIGVDYAIFTTILLLWWQIESPDNYSYHLKNQTMLYYLFPIIITVFQFRILYVVFSISLFMLLYGSFLAYGLHVGLETTTNWREYILGPGVILADVFTTKPAIFLCIAISIAYAIFRSIRMVRRIGIIETQKASLSRYFSPALVSEITNNPDIIMAGKRCNVTVLFCDIRGFTSMAEGMTPMELNDFLSDYRKRLTGAVFANGGMIDKYIGDAIMAVFGIPHPSPASGQDSRNAVAAAIDMLSCLEELNRERSIEGKTTIRVGIGIHTGEVFAGNIGSEGQIEYTVIGDVVNTASRIEGLCKEFSASMLISQDVFNETREMIKAEMLPPVSIRGKGKQITIYRIR